MAMGEGGVPCLETHGFWKSDAPYGEVGLRMESRYWFLLTGILVGLLVLVVLLTCRVTGGPVY